MKNLIYLIIIPLLMLGMGCSDDEKDTVIPTTDYVLGENYSWKDLEKEKIYRIDSEEELLKLVESEGEITKIDFEKNTLILVVGLNNSSINRIEKQLTRNNVGKYSLSIKVFNGLNSVLTPWSMAMQVAKVSDNENIELIMKK